MRINENYKKVKVVKLIKLLLLISMLILSYYVSDKFIDYILTIDVVMLKRILNIILVVLTVGIYAKKAE